MNKLLKFSLLFLSIFLLQSCDNSDDESTDNSTFQEELASVNFRQLEGNAPDGQVIFTNFQYVTSSNGDSVLLTDAINNRSLKITSNLTDNPNNFILIEYTDINGNLLSTNTAIDNRHILNVGSNINDDIKFQGNFSGQIGDGTDLAGFILDVQFNK
ncbi:hypothetical protein LX97_03432 [Nonlabens dokdonensis]|uniref:Lipoprotein n=2 Tax=Nonlabens dokdonensis TaxID=328515 RepID=L7WCT5_NONDD|nr:hypothetical protein [Nonlabens dokdonensis]AGC77889.1 hypothetical protein DDD_2762 [Nonlabens dokdonensis DSW-6]PZX36675.1 hypothetical protein LX97_03432 [Nonlabens dokdonensis]